MEKSIQIYNKKLDNYFDSNGKLLQYPSKRPMRIIVLIKIAEQMDENRKYTEKEINEMISLLESKDKIYIRVLTHELCNEYVNFQVFSNGEWSYR